jgi:multicomponent Na+:H+ antiporter subunit E
MIALRRVAAWIEIQDAEARQRSRRPDFPPAGPPRAAASIGHSPAGARWIWLLSASTGDTAPGLTRAAAARATLFLAFWLMISGWAPTDLPVGLAAVAGATWISLSLLPPGGSPMRMASLAWVAANFFRQSIVSGTDVAWRALAPNLRLRPGFVACPLRLPPGGKRSAFCALSSLMPGTLPTGTDERGALLVHCLDVGQPVAANLAAEERLFMRAVGGE